MPDNAWLAEILTGVAGLGLRANRNVHFQYAFCERAHEVADALRRHGIGVRVLGAAHGVRPNALRIVAPAMTSVTASHPPSRTWSMSASPPEHAGIIGVGFAAVGAVGYTLESTLFYLSLGQGVHPAVLRLPGDRHRHRMCLR